jgi:hypothetical protein
MGEHSPSELNLKKFDMSRIKDDATCMFIGKRGAGKSTLLKDVMYTKRHLPFGIACSGTEEGNGVFGKMIPKLFVYPDYDAAAITRMIERQRRMAETPQGCQPAFVVLDDCLYDGGVLKRKEIRQLFLNGRHYKFFTAVTAQFAGDVPPAIRANIDYLFVCRENIIQNRKRIFENFFGIMDNFKAFQTLMDQTTENYEVLVLDNTSKSNKIEDVVYWYKARIDLPDFKMGCRQYWEFSKKNERQPGAEKKKASSTSKVVIKVKKLQPTRNKDAEVPKKKIVKALGHK